MRRQAGYSLAELMIVTAVLVGVTGTLAAVGHSLHRADRVSAAYVDDISDLRRAVRTIERDARAGRLGSVTYTRDGARLLRNDRLLADNIGTFEIDDAGDVVVVRIGLKPRAATGARRPVIETRVRVREVRR